MKRKLIAVVGAAVLAVPLTACSASGEVDDEYGASSDAADCDAEDRRKKEIPDCGWKVNGKFREWSWVAAGQTKAPAGWRASQEKATTTGSNPKPKTTTAKKTTTGGGSKSGTSRTGGGTTTRKR